MFLLYKLAGSLVVPPGCFIVAILIIAALAMRKPRKPFLAGALCVLAAAMYVMSSPVFAFYINKPLGTAYEKPQLPPKDAKAAVIVLGGGSSLDENGKPFQPSAAAMERLYAAVKISKEQPWCSRLIFSGGDVYGRHKVSEAAVMKYAAKIMGCRKKIILEDQSRNTDENLKYCAEIVKKHGFKDVVVVTNNFHIERAMDFAYQYMPRQRPPLRLPERRSPPERDSRNARNAHAERRLTQRLLQRHQGMDRHGGGEPRPRTAEKESPVIKSKQTHKTARPCKTQGARFL